MPKNNLNILEDKKVPIYVSKEEFELFKRC